MSLSDGRSSPEFDSADEEENIQNDDSYIMQEDEYQPPLSAIPPKVILQEEGQAEVSSSPAFQCLDDLFQEGKLTGTKVALLKAKYTELHETLKRSRENELNLLRLAKDYTEETEKQKNDLESADDFPENCNTEVSKLRQILLQHNNTLKIKEDAQYQLEYQIQNLTEEQKILEREKDRLPNSAEMERKVAELQRACEDLKKEASQRQSESRSLKEDVERQNRNLKIEQELLRKRLTEVEQIKSSLVAENAKPGFLKKDVDRLTRQHRELEVKLNNIDKKYEETSAVEKNRSKQLFSAEEENSQIKRDLEQVQAKLQETEQKYDVLMKDAGYIKDRETMLLGDKGTLDMSLRHISLEKKNLHEMFSRRQRERDRDAKTYKKMELQLKIAADNLVNTNTVLEKVRSAAINAPKDDGSLQQKKDDLKKEVEQTKRALANQNSLTTIETVKVEQSIAMEERLLYQQGDLRIEVVELTRLAAIKNDEREQKARDFMRAEMRFNRAVQDVKTKDLQIQDYQKKLNELNIKLKDFAKLYDVIKTERNKCVHLIQTSTQKAAEMREKIKILQNEIEILRTSVAQKERLLQKSRMKHQEQIGQRDSVRNELAKQQGIDKKMRSERDEQQNEIDKLNTMINQTEEQVADQRKRYEIATQQRNEKGIQLIERNEEVCVFLEKCNIQDEMIRNGDVQMKVRDEETRFLKMQLVNERRELELMRKSIPDKKALEDELVTLNIQMQACQDRLVDLDGRTENANDPTRVRFLEGKDLPPDKMKDKLEELESRLATKEEQILEKDLILQQVTRLAQRVQKKSDSGKMDTLNLAKHVNELQAKIKEVTRKMMGLVSELSMKQAHALRLQQEVKEKESSLEQAYLRMEKNEPPSDDMEMEWNKYVRDENRRTKDMLEARMRTEEEEQYTLPGTITCTTAEPRPNAYIPDEENDLPIPRPYGAHAPFKPQEQSSNMRHIRKPVQKPIEI
ncbi:DgyrCDS8185 [Dimorphilus gyrociliatus]|uniref:DgyrCDS8185 n=1 Tax=Dimorphilus gyrociliatus TaxID=2664684 RepID=A0A7I8VTE2_9ANNE|nr:DgyrCDS8185 [Dimorphilus gyrociliatus]